MVVMNADGSRGVTAELTVGAKLGFLLWLGIALLTAGAILLFSGGAMILGGTRRRQAVAPALKAPPSQPGRRHELHCSLLWKSARGMKMAVAATTFNKQFEFDVAGADAPAIFDHPFAYAVCRGPGFGRAMRGSHVPKRSTAS